MKKILILLFMSVCLTSVNGQINTNYYNDDTLVKVEIIYDGADINKDNIVVTKAEIELAYKEVPEELVEVIRKALVELDGAPFKYFEAHRKEWAENTCYTYPGAIQYYGPTEVCDLTTRTLALEKGTLKD